MKSCSVSIDAVRCSGNIPIQPIQIRKRIEEAGESYSTAESVTLDEDDMKRGTEDQEEQTDDHLFARHQGIGLTQLHLPAVGGEAI